MRDNENNLEEDLQSLVDAAKEDPQATFEDPSPVVSEKKKQLINDSEEDDENIGLSFKTVISGDILKSRIVKRQVVFVIFCVVLMVIHTWNRYASQDNTLEIDQLTKELKDIKYKVLTQSSDLMNITRQSNVEQTIRHTSDSTLKSSVTAPFLLKDDTPEQE